MSTSRIAALQTSSLLLAASLLLGCGDPPPEFGQVTGVVTLRGKPAKDLLVRFLPDPGQGREIAVTAAGVTDATGRYTLKHAYQGKEGDGAVIGGHRVCIEDGNIPHLPQGAAPPPLRVPPQYSTPGTTPLTATVNAGMNENVNFDVK